MGVNYGAGMSAKNAAVIIAKYDFGVAANNMTDAIAASVTVSIF